MSSDDQAATYWVHNIDPFAIRFPEGFFLEGIRWYGLAYLVGFVIAGFLLHLYYKKGKSPLNPDQQATLLTALIIGILVGGRLGYLLLYQPDMLFSNPLSFFEVWKGGMASHGGMIGGALACIWFARKYRFNLWGLADIAVTLAPAGIFFGRIANFINGELWGKPTDVAWAVIFPIHDYAGNIVAYTVPSHPSQLYAAFLEGFVLFTYLQLRFWLSRPKSGQLAAEFLIAYACLRIIGEIFRLPDEGVSLIFGLSRGTFYSLLMLGIGSVIWFQRNKKPRPI